MTTEQEKSPAGGEAQKGISALQGTAPNTKANSKMAYTAGVNQPWGALPGEYDFVTILVSRGVRMAKHWKPDGKIDGAAGGLWFKVERHPVSNLRELSTLLTRIEADPYRCIIRGKPRDNWQEILDGSLPALNEERALKGEEPLEQPSPEYVLRRKDYFEDEPHHWFLCDVDDFPTSDDTDPLTIWRQRMPEDFRFASCHWQLSGSAGHPKYAGLYKAHLWFWSDVKHTSPVLKSWGDVQNETAGLKLVDRALFNEVQVHYTSGPTFAKGVVDPITVRSGYDDFDFIDGNQLSLVITEAITKQASAPTKSKHDLVDPRTKSGVFGAVHRAVEIEEIINRWLPDQFTIINDPRVTWHGGGGAAEGAYIRADRQGIGATHDSWPWGANRTANKVELVAHFMYGHLDQLVITAASSGDDFEVLLAESNITQWETSPWLRPSYKAAIAMFEELPEVQVEMGHATIEKARGVSAETRLDRSDLANVDLMFSNSNGDLRYLPERDLWINWTGQRWEQDANRSALQAVSRTVGDYYLKQAHEQREDAKAPGLTPDDRKKLEKIADGTEAWSTQCRNHRKLTDMQSQAKMDTRFTVDLKQLDSDPYLLGVQNGVVDLRTGQLHPGARDQFVTRRAAFNFDPSAPAPRWLQFISEITGVRLPVLKNTDGTVCQASLGKYTPRPGYARYLQKALGYCLTGLTSEQKIFICHGEGSNGKNILLDRLKEILPDYVAIIAPELLLASAKVGDAQAPSAATAALAGHRFAIASEAREDARLDVNTVKMHTGNKYMTARFLNKNNTTFEVTHKLWLMTNNKPRIDHMDKAISGRIHLLPFDCRWNRPGEERDPTLPDGDKHLEQTLQREAAGVLAWMIEGAARYFKEGLEPPEEVRNSTRDYLTAQDSFAAWIADRCEECKHKEGAVGSALFTDFISWCEFNGRKARPDKQGAFTDALKQRGHEPLKVSVMRYPLKLRIETLEAAQPNTDFDDIT